MAGQNDFLIFDESGTNMLSQEIYASDEDRTAGFKRGIARSNVNNKVLHQTSMMASSLGELIKKQGGQATDATIANLVSNLNRLFSIKKYYSDATFDLYDVVIDVYDGIKLCKSLQNNNTGHALSDTNYWEEVQLGGGVSRNIGEIVASTIPLTDAGLHLLDGTRLSGDGIYKGFIDYIADLYNDTKVYNPSAFTVVGNPTITADGIASGFSDSSYLTTTTLLLSGNFEIYGNFKLGSYFDNGLPFGLLGGSGLPIRLQPKSGGIGFYFYYNNTWIDNTTFAWELNTEYSFKVSYINSKLNLYLSKVNQQLVKYTNDISDWEHYDVTGVRFGFVDHKAFNGSIDLKQFSITVDGVEIVNGSTPANYFTTESDWQSSVSTYGSCGKFVYDSTLNTVRLPKATGIIEGTTDVSALGDLVEAGLPNIQGSFATMTEDTRQTDAFTTGTRIETQLVDIADKGGWGYPYQVYFAASNSNSIYGNSSTVQPQTIKAFYYIVIATSTKTDIQVDIDEVATDLNNKMDKSSIFVSGTTLVIS